MDTCNTRLITKHGEFVRDIYLPPFVIPPTVLLWGNRFFMLVSSDQGCLLYEEVSGYVCSDLNN